MQNQLLNNEQQKGLSQLANHLTPDQALWLSGYFYGRAQQPVTGTTITDQATDLNPLPKSKSKITVLFGTHTGRCEKIAGWYAKAAQEKGFETELVSIADFNLKKLTEVEHLALAISTHGEGEPPEMAEDFYRLMTGTKAPKLPNLKFSVLALGDRSYKYFCKTGIDLHHAMIKSGATAVTEVTTTDVDFEDIAKNWISTSLDRFSASSGIASNPLTPTQTTQNTEYSRKNPFLATVTEKTRITGSKSDKAIYHIELSLEDSGITYQPGDAVGVIFENPEKLVDDVIALLNADAKTLVNTQWGNLEFKNALKQQFEITILNRQTLDRYAELSSNERLLQLIQDESELDKYLFGHDILDLLTEFAFDLSAQQLIDILRPLPPRLYSISSSQEQVGNEVHITAAWVNYENKGRKRYGASSTWLADSINIDDKLPIYIEHNNQFRLPQTDKPIIMVGAGTGVAPYRAFLQHREANKLKGKSWLFFGERTFHSEFLYQTEWQKLLKNGTLEKLHVAFSRDQKEKVYVQHKLLEHQNEVFNWLQNGASFYVCGDKKNMANDVQKALLKIIETQGGLTSDKAEEYLKNLKREKRYLADVY